MRISYRKIINLPYLPVLVAPWILLAPVIFTGQAVFWGTPFLQFVPWRALAWEMISEGVIPLWNPLVGMGAPLLANYQSALFYPPNWILWILQLVGGVPAHAWGQAVLIAIHLMWAGIGMIRLTRDLGVSPLGQTVSGLAFSLSAYLVSRSGFLSINSAVAWMPWILWALNRIITVYRDQIEHRTVKRQLILWMPFVIFVTMQLLSGHAQTTWYTLLLAGLWILWSLILTGKRHVWQSVIPGVIAALLLAVALSAVQLFPTAEYLLQSQRSSAVDFDFAMNFSLDPWSLITFLAPDLFGNPARGDYWLNIYYWETAVYIGMLPFLLAVYAAVRAWFKKHVIVPDFGIPSSEDIRRSLSRFLLAVILVSILFALGKSTPIFPFLYKYVPTFDMFQAPARFSIWAVFSLSLLAGIGLDAWRRPEGKWLYWARLLTAGAFAITLGSGLTLYFLSGVRPTFIRSAALAGCWALGAGILTLLAPPKDHPARKPWWVWAGVIWVSIDLLAAGWGLNPGTDLSLYRTASIGNADQNPLTSGHRIFLPETDETVIKYQRFLPDGTLLPKEDWDRMRGVYLPVANILDNISSANNFDPLVPGRYARWMEHLNGLSEPELSAWLAWMDVSVIERYDAEAEMGIRFDAVEGAERFRWTGCAEYVGDDSEAWTQVQEKLRIATVISAADTSWSVVENAAGEDLLPCLTDSAATIEVLKDNPIQTTILVDSNTPGWLIQSDLWYPGWKAFVDGVPVPLYRANYLFRGVKVTAGDHTVNIIYQPVVFYAGAALTAITLLGTIAFSIFKGGKG